MPVESRAFVKAGILYLLLTFLVGAIMLVLEALNRPVPYVIGVEHAHLGTVGWLVNIVIGIALWMLPLNRQRYPQTQGRYPAGAAWACFWLLNGGLAIRVVAEPIFQLDGRLPALSAALVLSALAQLAAAALFAAIAWQRVRDVSAAARRSKDL